MEEKEKCCLTCMHEALPQGIDPCNKCLCHDEWMPKDGEMVPGFDPGAPEGDKTNVRRPWPLDGREINPGLLRKPSDIIDDDENGPVFAITRMPLQMVIGYAIDGIKDHVSKLGLLLTDRSKTEKDLEDPIIELRGLHTDWDSLETELEALRKAVEHGNG